MYSYKEDKLLLRTTLSMEKDVTSFLYFTLEANEGICFYSTLPFEKGDKYRDIVLYSTPELKPDLENILSHLKKTISFEEKELFTQIKEDSL